MSTLNRISELLTQQGKKQKDLTDFLGISKNSFTDWKSGRIKSYVKHIPQIAEFLGVSTDYLLGIEHKDSTPVLPTPVDNEILFFHNEFPLPFNEPDTFIATHREMEMIKEYRKNPKTKNAINQIMNKENPTVISNDETLTFALFGDDNADITPEMLDDVRKFAKFIREQRKDADK